MPKSNIGNRLRKSPFVEQTRVNTPITGLTASLKDMKIGDCILFKCSDHDRVETVQHRISSLATHYCYKLCLVYKETFTTRVIVGGVAIFRIGE